MKKRPKKDPAIKARIVMEAVVDAYDEEERSLGWYYYLENKMTCPFQAEVIQELATSPLRKGEQVSVKAMASEDECVHRMLVTVDFQGRDLAVPLEQLRPAEPDDEEEEYGDDIADADTREAVEDWRYWCERGYAF